MTLRCLGLRKSFDGVKALSGVDLEFSPSSITAIIGPNGAGKTTLINVLTGFLKPEAGYCFFGLQDITHLSAPLTAQLGIGRTFQDLRMMTEVSARENLMLARPRQRGETLVGALLRVGVRREEWMNYQEATKVLRLVGLEDKASHLVREFSYGQQKLLSIGCCLAMGAKVLLLDEPVAGVHPEMANRILSLIKDLRDRGKTIVFIEHDISAVRAAADHVVVMDHGQVIAEGVPHEILDRPEIMEAYIA
jgi:ABC-type branched-subunit amino acid transport system ATPase component